MDVSPAALRVLRSVAERGSFSAAAVELGYTQSGISRQAAALEREAGTRLFERQPAGVRLTAAGLILLGHACTILDELAAAQCEIAGVDSDVQHVRLGVYISAGAVLLPRTLTALRHRRDIRVTTREGTTPVLVRAVRAGTLDLAVIASRPPHRPPDAELPLLELETIREANLLVAASANGRFAGRDSVTADELADVDWIASPSSGAESLLGVWPGLAGRPRIAHTARDWLTKLQLVAAGCGVTTVPAGLASVMPDGVILLSVEDGTAEARRMLVARMPGKPSAAVSLVLAALRGSAQ
ncbi:MAG TPA: LysR family transcriptional regulator [Mycobacterium sp.]|nr:LysR family transcriptional regulator [Mycobacterium sp.]HUH67819.1 LysR family transcriptional regulator [Mycobacterium sp.]